MKVTLLYACGCRVTVDRRSLAACLRARTLAAAVTCPRRCRPATAEPLPELPPVSGSGEWRDRAERRRAEAIRGCLAALERWRRLLDRYRDAGRPHAGGEANYAVAVAALEELKRHTTAEYWIRVRYQDPVELLIGREEELPRRVTDSSGHGKRLSEGQIAELRRLYAEGWTLRQAAAHVGCSVSTAQRWVETRTRSEAPRERRRKPG